MSTATLVDAPPAVGTKMRQVVVESFGGPDRLTLVDSPIPEPVLGEVRVRTVAAGVSYPDILIREGTYPGGPRPPLTPGYDIVGVVDKLGPGAGGFAPGDMVTAITVFGSYAEALCIPQEHLVADPASRKSNQLSAKVPGRPLLIE